MNLLQERCQHSYECSLFLPLFPSIPSLLAEKSAFLIPSVLSEISVRSCLFLILIWIKFICLYLFSSFAIYFFYFSSFSFNLYHQSRSFDFLTLNLLSHHIISEVDLFVYTTNVFVSRTFRWKKAWSFLLKI